VTSAGRRIYWVLVVAVIVASTLTLAAWRLAEEIPSGHDAPFHFPKTISFSQTMFDRPADMPDLLARQSARYGPLTYVVGAVVLRALGRANLAFTATSLLFWVLTLLALAAIGARLAPRWWLALLPLLAFLATRTAWEIGTAYNLELGLSAAVFGSIALALRIDRWRAPGVVFAVLAVFVFAFSKSVFAVLALPALVLLVFVEPEHRARRLALALAAAAGVGLWLAAHAANLPLELAMETDNPGQWRPLSYYARVLLIDFRAAPLLAAFVALAALTARRRAWRRRDLFFAALTLVPFAFFFTLDTKRAWYILPPFVGLAMWAVDKAVTFWENPWVRRGMAALVAVSALAALAGGLGVFAAARNVDSPCGRFVDLASPGVTTAAEDELAARLVADVCDRPGRRVAVHLGSDFFSAVRLRGLLQLRCPAQIGRETIAVDDPHGGGETMFREALAAADTVVLVAGPWPEHAAALKTPFALETETMLPGEVPARWFTRTPTE
jgi:hypothetical protein